METPAHKTEITQADTGDFEAMKVLLDRANEYSVERSGLPGWTAMDHVHAQLAAQLRSGELYVLRDDEGGIAASVAFSEDPGEWGQDSRDDPALYFHKFLKNPDKALPGDGLKLIGFVAQEALRRKKTLLRCDTVSELDGLINYYDRLGFVDKGRFTYASSGRDGILLEAETEEVIKSLNMADD